MNRKLLSGATTSSKESVEKSNLLNSSFYIYKFWVFNEWLHNLDPPDESMIFKFNLTFFVEKYFFSFHYWHWCTRVNNNNDCNGRLDTRPYTIKRSSWFSVFLIFKSPLVGITISLVLIVPLIILTYKNNARFGRNSFAFFFFSFWKLQEELIFEFAMLRGEITMEGSD